MARGETPREYCHREDAWLGAYQRGQKGSGDSPSCVLVLLVTLSVPLTGIVSVMMMR